MRWRPSKFVQLVMWLHLLIGLVVCYQPLWWPQGLILILGLHLLLALVGMFPRCSWLGQNQTRFQPHPEAKPFVCLTFDDGPDPQLTPAVLAILAEHEVAVTFFCIGERVRQYPEIARQIVAAGHQLENHGLAHRVSNPCSGWRGWQREIQGGSEVIETITGVRPTCYRPMAGLRNPLLDPVLQRLSVKQVTWSRRAFDTRETRSQVVLEKLTRQLQSGEILLLHDGHAAKGEDGQPVILSVLPSLLTTIKAQGLDCCTLAEATQRSVD